MTLRRVVLLALFLLPLLWWVEQGLLDANVEFLPPGRGTWVVDSRWYGGRDLPPTRYRLELAPLTSVPARVEIEVSAMREFRLAINGRPRFDSSGAAARNWKNPLRLDLAPWLEPGFNQVAFEVFNDQGPTPLRIQDVEDHAPRLATGVVPWEASVHGPYAPAVRAGHGEADLVGKEWRWHHPGRYQALLLALALLISVGLIKRPRAYPKPTVSRPRGRGVILAVLAVIVAANLWNGANFPYRRSHLDWGGHTTHVSYAATTWRPSLAHEGWQMYQPPLYYWLAARAYLLRGGDSYLMPSLRYVQILTALIGALHMAVVALVLSRFGPTDVRPRALALLALGLAPMSLTTNAMITNEPAAGLFGGIALAAASFALARTRLGVGRSALLGVLCGLALLTKFSGLMPTAAIGLVLALRVATVPAQRRSNLAAVIAFGVSLLAVAGPYYARNYASYGKLFVGNWDRVSGFGFEQLPGYRTLDFYTRIGQVFTHQPERARWSSMWDGLYATTWGEIHDNFLSTGSYHVSALLLVMFALALVPTAAGLRGAARALRASLSPDPRGDVQLVLVATTVFSVAAVAVFMMAVPAFSTVKAFFLLHLLVPAALYIAWGLDRMSLGLGRARVLLDVCGVALAGVTLWTVLWR